MRLIRCFFVGLFCVGLLAFANVASAAQNIQLKGENTVTAPNPSLAYAIACYYGIPKSEWQGTRYFYNYVELQKGKPSILAVVVGPYTCGTGGCSALLLDSQTMQVQQSFTLVNAPIILADNATGKAFPKQIIVSRREAANQSNYVALNYNGLYYTPVASAPTVKLDSLKNPFVVCADLNSLLQQQKGLTLAD